MRSFPPDRDYQRDPKITYGYPFVRHGYACDSLSELNIDRINASSLPPASLETKVAAKLRALFLPPQLACAEMPHAWWSCR